MNDFDPHAYTITVRRVTVDGEHLFSATVAELPDVETFESTYRKAYDLVIEAIKALHEQAEKASEDFPLPAEYQERYSGRVTLRIPASLHRKLATKATMEGVSLNALITATLAEGCGQGARSSSSASANAFPLSMQSLRTLKNCTWQDFRRPPMQWALSKTLPMFVWHGQIQTIDENTSTAMGNTIRIAEMKSLEKRHG